MVEGEDFSGCAEQNKDGKKKPFHQTMAAGEINEEQFNESFVHLKSMEDELSKSLKIKKNLAGGADRMAVGVIPGSRNVPSRCLCLLYCGE